MKVNTRFKEALFTLGSTQPSSAEFVDLALQVFRYQAVHNPIYRDYLHYLRRDANQINRLEEIPFLPIEFFKHHPILTNNPSVETIFESSGTTGQTRSRHFVADPAGYLSISEQIFEQSYGPLSQFHVLALLPSYLERKNSSLVYMVQHFIEKSQSDCSGFFLHNVDELVDVLYTLAQSTERPCRKVLLIGVTFALLDLAESGQDWSFLRHIPELIVMETGGMKGRREELLREEVHEILTQAFHVDAIHSEYGMTELLSQAYSKGEGIFGLPPTMRILLRDVNDPFSIDHSRRNGGINVVDLANIDSCAFIETKDLGSFADANGGFRVLGRFDNSDIRGCNLMLG
jgi:hypothetical protein